MSSYLSSYETELKAVATALLITLLLFLLRVSRFFLRRVCKIGRIPLPPSKTNRAKSGGKDKVDCVAVLGSGGHTSELLQLVDGFDPTLFQFHFIATSSDPYCVKLLTRHGFTVVQDGINERGNNKGIDGKRKDKPEVDEQQINADPTSTTKKLVHLYRIRRSRQVGEGWVSSAWNTFASSLQCLWLWYKVPVFRQSHLLLVNGPGVCIPVVFSALFFEMLGLHNCKGATANSKATQQQHLRLIFVESFARTQSISLTGRILRPVCDRFIVQWMNLATRKVGSTFVKRDVEKATPWWQRTFAKLEYAGTLL
ncbi:unnamed protein product [Amoebophrya sp. A120]|nr:unnamed protein product [Amoebophrya sp. A120]|eukprot:GSA120T00012900001.1